MAPSVEQPSLTVLSGSMAGTEFIVDDSLDNILIGSDASCGFALPGTGVDRIHARLWIDLEGIIVADVNSPRGVYINDDRVQGEARLRNGDILWLGPPGDGASVMLQCRLTEEETFVGTPPPLPRRAAAPAPTVSLIPEPTLLLAPDAIQPEPPVMLAPEDAFLDPEPTIAMLPDDLELAEALAGDMDPAAALLDEPPPTFTGWDPTAGGITSASDPPWMQGAPAFAPDADPGATIPPVPLRAPEPPPLPATAPKPAVAPRPARATETPPAPRPPRGGPPAAPTPRRRPAARRPRADDHRMAPQPRKGAPMALLVAGGLLAAGGWWMLARRPAPEGHTAAPPTVGDASRAPRPPDPADPDASVSDPAAVVDAPVEEEVTIVPRAEPLKTFIPGLTVVQTRKAKSDVAGNNTRIEFAVNPPQVKPGDNYTVQIFLVNEGKKAIKVSGVSATTDLNGSKSTRSVASQVWEVAAGQRALLGELPGVWPEGVDAWSAQVMVSANAGDSIKNLLTWK